MGFTNEPGSPFPAVTSVRFCLITSRFQCVPTRLRTAANEARRRQKDIRGRRRLPRRPPSSGRRENRPSRVRRRRKRSPARRKVSAPPGRQPSDREGRRRRSRAGLHRSHAGGGNATSGAASTPSLRAPSLACARRSNGTRRFTVFKAQVRSSIRSQSTSKWPFSAARRCVLARVRTHYLLRGEQGRADGKQLDLHALVAENNTATIQSETAPRRGAWNLPTKAQTCAGSRI